MPKMIKLHHYISGKSIWLNPDAIISIVVDETVTNPCTRVYTYAFAGEALDYRVAETPETVAGMIEQTCVNLEKEA